ncbi:hypothetical protein, partial [Amycolatopsis magusensis]
LEKKATGRVEKIMVPGTWEELEPSQMLALVPLLQARKPASETRLRVLLILLKLKSRLHLQRTFRGVSAEGLLDMLLLTDFLFEAPRILTQKFPRIGELHGPKDALSGTVFIEFIRAEKHYLQFSKTADPEQLDRMVAVLWREADPKKKAGDLRARYTDDTLPHRLKVIASWPLAQKMSLYLWFDSCRQQLVQTFPLVFPKTAQKQEFNPLARPKGWIDVATSLAENVTNVEEVFYTDLHVLFLFMSNKLEEAEEFKRKNKQKPK